MNSTVCEGEYPVIELSAEAKVKPLRTSEATFKLLEKFGYGETEVTIMITLDENDYVISAKIVSIGGRSTAIMSICDMMRSAIQEKASSIIVVHTHPGGDCTPSDSDEEFVNDLRLDCTVLGIELVDSLIISNGKFQSMFAKRIAMVKTARTYLGMVFGSLSYLGVLMQEVAGVVLSIFVIWCYIAVSNGQSLPPLDSGVATILFLYPLSWVVKTLGRFFETIVVE